jgi:hypothetical protein
MKHYTFCDLTWNITHFVTSHETLHILWPHMKHYTFCDLTWKITHFVTSHETLHTLQILCLNFILFCRTIYYILTWTLFSWIINRVIVQKLCHFGNFNWTAWPRLKKLCNLSEKVTVYSNFITVCTHLDNVSVWFYFAT